MKRYSFLVLLLAIILWRTIPANSPKRVDPVAYHKAEMRAAWDEASNNSPEPIIGNLYLGEDKLDPAVRYLTHLEELVQLGAYIKREYRFENILARTPQGYHLLKIIINEMCPPMEYFQPSIADDPTQFRTKVWFEKKHLEEWDQFMREHDVADFEEKFMDSDPANEDGDKIDDPAPVKRTQSPKTLTPE